MSKRDIKESPPGRPLPILAYAQGRRCDGALSKFASDSILSDSSPFAASPPFPCNYWLPCCASARFAAVPFTSPWPPVRIRQRAAIPGRGRNAAGRAIDDAWRIKAWHLSTGAPTTPSLSGLLAHVSSKARSCGLPLKPLPTCQAVHAAHL